MTSATPESSEQLRVLEGNLELQLKKHGEYYAAISDGTDGLLINNLAQTERSDIVLSDPFKDIVSKIGWPNRLDRDNLAWTQSFAANEAGNAAFANALLIADHRELKDLNNFHVYMRCKPADISEVPIKFDFSEGMDTFAYGTAPFFIRANVVAPELFESLRNIYKNVGINNMWDYLQGNNDPSAPLITAMRTAYGIMGKCVRSDDDATLLRMYGQDPSTAVPIEDVSMALTR